jgi:hypothetical protein
MFPVTTETTVSACEQAHLPSNMFSIPQAEQCTAQLRKRPPLSKRQSHGTWATVSAGAQRRRRPVGGAVRRDSENAPSKLHFTVPSKQSHGLPSVFPSTLLLSFPLSSSPFFPTSPSPSHLLLLLLLSFSS